SAADTMHILTTENLTAPMVGFYLNILGGYDPFVACGNDGLVHAHPACNISLQTDPERCEEAEHLFGDGLPDRSRWLPAAMSPNDAGYCTKCRTMTEWRQSRTQQLGNRIRIKAPFMIVEKAQALIEDYITNPDVPRA